MERETQLGIGRVSHHHLGTNLFELTQEGSTLLLTWGATRFPPTGAAEPSLRFLHCTVTWASVDQLWPFIWALERLCSSGATPSQDLRLGPRSLGHLSEVPESD